MSINEYMPPEVTLPQGSPTPQEIWTNTTDILKQAPAAYQGSQTVSRFYGSIDVITSLWGFSTYDPKSNTWDHIAVQGDSVFGDIDPELRRALVHFNAKGRELTSKEQKAGLLGYSAISLLGKAVGFPHRDLLLETLEQTPETFDQLTVMVRAGRGEQVKLNQSCKIPVRYLDNPSRPPAIPGGSRSTWRQKEEPEALASLLELNGRLEKLLPNFGRSKFKQFPTRK